MPGDLKPVYLLTGSDRPKVERALRRLRDRFGAGSVERLSAREASGPDAVAACNSLGLFAAGRLVLVDEVDRWTAEDAKAVADYLASPAPETVLALVGDQVKKDGPLARACAKAGDVLAYELSKRDLPRWVREQFARSGVGATAEACRLLVELAGGDVRELATEIDKIAAYAGGNEVDAADVELLVAARADVAPFVLTDAWGRRDPAGVLTACEAILERSGPREVHALVGRIAAHVRRVATCQRLEAEGVRPRDAAGRLRVHPFAAEKAFTHGRTFSTEELRDAIVRLAELDLALKGGSRLPPELELERALVAITRGRDRP